MIRSIEVFIRMVIFIYKWQKISISEPDTHLQVEKRLLKETFPILIKLNVFMVL